MPQPMQRTHTQHHSATHWSDDSPDTTLGKLPLIRLLVKYSCLPHMHMHTHGSSLYTCPTYNQDRSSAPSKTLIATAAPASTATALHRTPAQSTNATRRVAVSNVEKDLLYGAHTQHHSATHWSDDSPDTTLGKLPLIRLLVKYSRLPHMHMHTSTHTAHQCLVHSFISFIPERQRLLYRPPPSVDNSTKHHRVPNYKVHIHHRHMLYDGSQRPHHGGPAVPDSQCAPLHYTPPNPQPACRHILHAYANTHTH
jgi:hypothetical protein